MHFKSIKRNEKDNWNIFQHIPHYSGKVEQFCSQVREITHDKNKDRFNNWKDKTETKLFNWKPRTLIVNFQRRDLNLTKSWMRVMCRRKRSQGEDVGVAGGEGKERDPVNEVVRA